MASTNPALRVEPLTESFGTRIEGGGAIARVDPEQLVTAYKASGAVLLTGFDADLAGFEALTRRHTRDFITIKTGHKQGVGDDASTQTLYYRENTLVPLHQELGYSPRTPEMLWLYCMAPVAERGETLLCDGVELWRHLDPDTRALFADKPITYFYRGAPETVLDIFLGDVVDAESAPEGLWLERNPDGSVDLDYTVSAVAAPSHGPARKAFVNSLLIESGTTRFADGTEVAAELREELDRTAAEITFLHAWQPGDVLMLDNRRLMHGRAPYADPTRRVVSRIGAEAF